MTKTAAVILAAGLGGRFLPASKSINKCMMPVHGKPVLQHVIEECVDAGLDKIVVVVSSGDTSTAEHFRQSSDLQRKLAAIHKGELYEKHVAPMAEYESRLVFVEQPESEEYGTTIALKPAMSEIDQSYSHVFVLNGDGIIARPKSIYGEAKDALASLSESDVDGLFFGVPVALEDRSRYGVFIQDTVNPSVVTEIVEKPDSDFAPESLLINIGWYILPREKLQTYLEETERNPIDNEFNIVHTINDMMSEYRFMLHPVSGVFLDCGTPEKWLAANNYLAKNAG